MIGGLDWLGLGGVGMEPNPDYAPTIPHQAFMIFQAMFAVITPALITGAFAERKRFKAFVLFTLLWATFVYDPLAHWIWGTGGWLKTLGALAFAGGTVVHISSGVSALVAALVLGPRLGLGRDSMDPHDATMAVLGAVLLWFGWFGFNAGSALSVNGAGANGLVYGDSTLLWKQLLAVMVTWVYAAAATWIILKVVDATVGPRVAEQEEVLGLDATQHGETAYQSDKPRWRQPELSATSQDPK